MPAGNPPPDRLSLRHLKIEAKRRLAVGEFAALHDAQTAIAREHGQPSWTALKRLTEENGSYALAQLRWLLARFGQAHEPDWRAPDDAELGEHFTQHYLSAVQPELVEDLKRAGPALASPILVRLADPVEAMVTLNGVDVSVAVEAAPPYRISGLRVAPASVAVTDPRIAAAAPARLAGPVPGGVAGVAEEELPGQGLPGLVLAGGDPGAEPWVVAKGWADLDRREVLLASHRFHAVGVSALVTAFTALRLVADGAFGLDDHANAHLRTVRLADPEITVRELLSNTAGVGQPTAQPADLGGPAVRELRELTGPVLACPGKRGVFRPSNGGYAALGQLIEDVTGEGFAAVATRLVLEPLGMTASRYPASIADLDDTAVTGYQILPRGRFEPVPAALSTIQALGGLWAPAADLIRLATGWPSLLPADLAEAAATPQAPGSGGLTPALAWLLRDGGAAGLMAGAGPGFTAELDIRIRDNRAHAVLTNRQVLIEPIEERLMSSWTEGN